MKTISRRQAFVVLALLLPGLQGGCFKTEGPPGGKTKWNYDYEESRRSGRIEKRGVVLVVSGPSWCGPCKMLEREVFEKFDFGQRRPDLIWCYVEVPRGGNALSGKVSEDYNIKGVPTIILLDKDGVEVTRGGYSPDMDPVVFMTWVNRYL